MSEASCSNVKFDTSFSMFVLENTYTHYGVSNPSATDSSGNKYAVVTGAGYDNSTGSAISYEGALARFTYNDVEEGTEFMVVSGTAACNDVTTATLIAKLVAEETESAPTEEPTTAPTEEPTYIENSPQTADITYENGTAVITIYTKAFDVFEVGVVSEASCDNVSFDTSFRMFVDGDNYTYAGVTNSNCKDSCGNKYAVITGAGCDLSTGADIPYEGVMARFTYNDVEEGTEFIVVSGTSAYDDVTQAPRIAKLVAGESGPAVEPTVAPTSTPDADSPVIEVQDTVARAGNTIQVPVVIKNNPGIAAVAVDIEYDSDSMTLKSATNNNLFNGAMYTTSSSTSENPYKMIWVVGTSDITSNGTLATLEFEIKEGVEAGEYPISISYNEDDIYNMAFENVHFYTVDGTVTVKDTMPGDVNDDDKVNTKDAAMLLQYFVGIIESIDEEVADVNNDGKVNSKDASKILQYYAGWDVTLE